VKLAKTLSRVGFVLGFIGPVLFYASPTALPTYESHVLCPACPYIDIAFATKTAWLELGMEFGLLNGLCYALIGFGIGYCISRSRQSTT
jgi:hypothetical protein